MSQVSKTERLLHQLLDELQAKRERLMVQEAALLSQIRRAEDAIAILTAKAPE